MKSECSAAVPAAVVAASRRHVSPKNEAPVDIPLAST